ncbi:MAG: SpoIIE family protein phosphatase [Peptococcaceae bacterium]|nr:SpoIIE family protein phosphatase [Peptococcaceae bacterium]
MMDNLCLEMGHISINKHSETICGDFYCLLEDKDKDRITLVLSDGLGSGVKANIQATLTARILSTMLAHNLPIDECIDTVAGTLPVCKVRKLAYATFTALQVEENHAYLVQYDNPGAILLRGGKSCQYNTGVRFVGEKEIHETRLELQKDDLLVLMTDGVTNVGIGKIMPEGWLREDVIRFLETWYSPELSPRRMAALLGQACLQLGLDSLDDDTTVLVLKVRERQAVNMIIGPPENKNEDNKILKMFFAKAGAHIVCGGTTAHTVSQYLKKPLIPMVESGDETIPAMAGIEGVDLVTEGVITLRKLVELGDLYLEDNMLSLQIKDRRDAVSLLADYLFEKATDVSIFFGMAANPAHEQLEIDFDTKLALVKRLEAQLAQLGKNVKLSLC